MAAPGAPASGRPKARGGPLPPPAPGASPGGRDQPAGGAFSRGSSQPGPQGEACPLPAFWYWESFLEWLLQDAPAGFAPRGHEGPVPETRTHVALDPAAQTAREGFLFQTSGLEFVRGGAASPWCSGPRGRSPRGSSPWGERRLAFWQKGGPGVPPLPEEVVAGLLRHRAARLVFLTPAFLGRLTSPRGGPSKGLPWWPRWWGGRLRSRAGTSRREAQAEPPGRARGERLLRPAPGGLGEGEVRDWAEKVWFQNLSEEEQDRRDGFGLAALGLWDGKLRRWEEA